MNNPKYSSKGCVSLLPSAVVCEKISSYTDHDRLFKELIQTFFQEFIETFFPEEYPNIDFSSVKFLSQEVFTDILKGEKRRIDILAETKLKGEDRLILIHVEPQSTFQKEFNERMFIYCTRLYEKYRIPILPIAIFSYNDRREVPKKFSIKFPTIKVIEFHYLQVHLIKMNWREYLNKESPVTAALLCKMGYEEYERVQVKLEFLRMLSHMELNPAKMELIYGFFETYLQLKDEEEVQMREEISRLPDDEANSVLRLPNSYYEKGIERVVFQMLKKGFPDDVIAELANLSLAEVKKMRRRMEEEKVNYRE